MIGVGVVVETTGWPAASKRDLSQVKRTVLEKVGLDWHGRFLPRHFNTSAENKYGYAQRTRGYKRRKIKNVGHSRPLVYTGTMEREATKHAVVRTSSNTARVTMRARALNFAGKAKRKGASYPDMRMELTAITTQEIKALATKGEQLAVKTMSKIRRTRRKGK